MASLASSRPNEPVAPDLLRLIPSAGVLAAIVGLFVAVGSGLPSTGRGVDLAQNTPPGFQQVEGAAIPAPESDPAALVPVSAMEAAVRNASIPFADGPNPAAAAFQLPADEVARMRSIDCLTAAVYYEAGLESTDGQRAVAQVILNRVRHPHYPNSVCGVVFQGHERRTGCQFTFTCDGSLRRTPAVHLWTRARTVAEQALAGYVHRPIGWATHYHANYVLPYWASSLSKVATIGAHIFYRWDSYGRPGRFAGRYVGAEPAIAWRGGFGQPEQAPVLAGADAPLDARDALAAAAGAAAVAGVTKEEEGGTAFLRRIVRRYEPVNAESAPQIIDRSVQARPTTNSSRWALTGRQSEGSSQAPLGRRDPAAAPVVELDGVRRRPATPAPAPAGNSTESR